MKSSFLYCFNHNQYTYELSITKWCLGLTDKTSNWKYIELLKNGFKTGETLIRCSVTKIRKILYIESNRYRNRSYIQSKQ